MFFFNFWTVVYFSTFKYHTKFYHTNCTSKLQDQIAAIQKRTICMTARKAAFINSMSRNRTRKFISICLRARSNIHSKFCNMWHSCLVCNIPFNLGIRFWIVSTCHISLQLSDEKRFLPPVLLRCYTNYRVFTFLYTHNIKHIDIKVLI